MPRILIVEDEVELANVVKDWLTEDHYVVETIADGLEALAQLRKNNYELVILDWLLPGLSGIEICRSYRAEGGSTPVLMLTAKRSLDAKEKGLDAGADDYLTKPFQLRELSARVRALLRRPVSHPVTVYKKQNLSLDITSHQVIRDGKPVHLLPKEFLLLEFFMRYPGQVFNADALLDRIWGTDTSVTPETVRSYIKSLRKKIDLPGSQSKIQTVHGFGYKFEAD